MSSMMPPAGLPASISVGGGGPSGATGPGGPDQGDSGPGGDTNVVGLLKDALKKVLAAADAEPDDGDTAGIHKIAALISQQIGNEQKLTDTAMGAGPGVKLIRKATASGGPAQGSGY